MRWVCLGVAIFHPKICRHNLHNYDTLIKQSNDQMTSICTDQREHVCGESSANRGLRRSS